MAREKASIIVMKNGRPLGFIKSISYVRGSFNITDDRRVAKKYSYNRPDRIEHDIDFLTKYHYDLGYVFVYT